MVISRRPITDTLHTYQMLQAQPALLSFAAAAKQFSRWVSLARSLVPDEVYGDSAFCAERMPEAK